MKRLLIFKLLLLSLLLQVHQVNAEILFEGYSKVLISDTHIGFFISRYEFDPIKKIFTSVYLLKTNELGGSISESLKASANERLEPISYEYTNVSKDPNGKNITKTIDAKFKKNKLTLKITTNGKSVKSEKKIQAGVFLSTFLGYVMLKSPSGIKTGSKYEYQAIAEEDGELYKGIAAVGDVGTHKNIKVYNIENDFKGSRFLSKVTETGEILSTEAPLQSVKTELEGDPSNAIKGFQISDKNLKLLFGSVPKGQSNALSKVLLQNQNQVPTQNQSQTQIPLQLKSPSLSPTPTQIPLPSQSSEFKTASPEQVQKDNKLKLSKPLDMNPPLNVTPSKEIGFPEGKGIDLKTGSGVGN